MEPDNDFERMTFEQQMSYRLWCSHVLMVLEEAELTFNQLNPDLTIHWDFQCRPQLKRDTHE